MSARASFRHAGMRLSTIAALNQALHEGEAHAQLGPPLTVEALVGELGADVLGQLALIGDQRFDVSRPLLHRAWTRIRKQMEPSIILDLVHLAHHTLYM